MQKALTIRKTTRWTAVQLTSSAHQDTQTMRRPHRVGRWAPHMSLTNDSHPIGKEQLQISRKKIGNQLYKRARDWNRRCLTKEGRQTADRQLDRYPSPSAGPRGSRGHRHVGTNSVSADTAPPVVPPAGVPLGSVTRWVGECRETL